MTPMTMLELMELFKCALLIWIAIELHFLRTIQQPKGE